jgi:hypothetical protein
MDRRSDAPGEPRGSPSTVPAGPFGITLKGWRSQLRWAMTQREEDPARVWLEIISIDERSKRALALSHDPDELSELRKFRERLESSIAELTSDLGDENVAPLYSWLDLARQRLALLGSVERARAAVLQARAQRTPDGSSAPATDKDAAEQLGRAQGQVDQWRTATPPAPPPAVLAIWTAKGGDALAAQMNHDAMAVGKRGDEARRVLARAAGREPGKHPWARSRLELILIPVVGVAALLFAVFAASLSKDSEGAARALAALATSSAVALAALLACSVIARRRERAEVDAALDWVWHARMYDERRRLAELEAGWLRALVDAHRALDRFDSKAGTGGQLREFETWRPDLVAVMQEVARDTGGDTDTGETDQAGGGKGAS